MTENKDKPRVWDDNIKQIQNDLKNVCEQNNLDYELINCQVLQLFDMSTQAFFRDLHSESKREFIDKTNDEYWKMIKDGVNSNMSYLEYMLDEYIKQRLVAE